MPAFLFGALPLQLSGLADNPLLGLQIRQGRLESLLEQRAAELGVDLRRGHRLRELRQEDDVVTVQVQGPDDCYELRTRYLIGSDGAGSGVRKMIGVSFAGFTGQITDLLAGSDVRYRMHTGTAHALTGRFAPDLDLSIRSRDTRLAELVRPGRPHLLDLTGSRRSPT